MIEPINVRWNAFFAEHAEEGAQWGLLCLMTSIREECWAASGMIDLEFALWDAIQGNERGYGMCTLTERQATLLSVQ